MEEKEQFRREFLQVLHERTGWSEDQCVAVLEVGGHDDSGSATDAVEDYLAETAGELDEGDLG